VLPTLENGHLAWYLKANRFVGAVNSELMFLKKLFQGSSGGVGTPVGKRRVG
jgi:hypothetical protein